MENETKLKIFFGILIIFGLYISYRNQVETYAPVNGTYTKLIPSFDWWLPPYNYVLPLNDRYWNNGVYYI